MAKFVVPLKKEIEDSLTRQGVQNVGACIEIEMERASETKSNEYVFQIEHTNAVKMNTHLILHSSSRALVTTCECPFPPRQI